MIKTFAIFKIRVFAAAAICSLAAVTCFVSAASATPPIDQSNLTATPNFFYTDSIQTIAQTFTVGITGSLAGIAVEMADSGSTPSAPLNVELTQLNAGKPDNTQVLATGTIAAASVTSSYQTFDVPLSSAVPVTVGQQYAIILFSTSTGEWRWGTDEGNDYAGGTASYSSSPAGPFNNLSWDQSFATFVSPPSVSAPGDAPRGAYCTAPGNTNDGGASLAAGTFVNLDDGQAGSDPHYSGAKPANFVAGVGLTCAAPPAGYTQHGFATADMNVDANTYPYYSAP